MKKKFPAEVRLGLSVAYYWEDCGSILTPAGRAGLRRLAICMYAAGFFSFLIIVTMLIVLEFLII